MRRPSSKNPQRGLAKLEQLLVIVLVCLSGLWSFADIGAGLSNAIQGTAQSSVVTSALERPTSYLRTPALRSTSSAATGALARLAKLETLSDIARASLGRTARRISEQIPLEKVRAASNLIDDSKVHHRKLRSIEDLAVIDLEFLRVKQGLEGQYPDWWVFEIGLATMENGREVTRSIELDVPLNEYDQSRNFRSRGKRNPIDYEEAIVSVAREVVGRELAFYNNVDGPRLLGAIDEKVPQIDGITRISDKRIKSLHKVDQLAKKDPVTYGEALEKLEGLLRAHRALDDSDSKAARIKFNRQMGAFKRYSKKNFGQTINPDDLALAELRRRLRHEEQIDLLVAVRMHEYDGRANNLTAVSQRKLPRDQWLTEHVDGEELAESAAHQADVDALATYRIARTENIKSALETDLTTYLREQLAFRALDQEMYNVVGAGIEDDPLLAKSFSELSVLHIEAAGTEARAAARNGRMIGLGIAAKLDESDLVQAFHISDTTRPIPEVGQELRIRPVRYKVPFDTSTDFVEIEVTRASQAAHRISNRAVHGSKAEDIAPKPTFPELEKGSLRRTLNAHDVVASWGKDVEEGLFGAEYYSRIAEKGSTALPTILRREFIDPEKIFVNLLNSRARKQLNEAYKINVDSGDRVPLGIAYKLLFNTHVTKPEGNLNRNAAMVRRVMLELQRRELLPETLGEVLELQRGETRPKRVFDWEYDELTTRTVGGK